MPAVVARMFVTRLSRFLRIIPARLFISLSASSDVYFVVNLFSIHYITLPIFNCEYRFFTHDFFLKKYYPYCKLSKILLFLYI